MIEQKPHNWTFRNRFRRHAFGWRSYPAIERIGEAVSEIKKAAHTDPVLGAEGAVLFLGKVSAAIEQVDGSSGAIGTAVNAAIRALVPIIAGAPANARLHTKWLGRLWRAVEEDHMPYLESLTDYWGELCATPERASRWADDYLPSVRLALSESLRPPGSFDSINACLSALCKAGRNQEVLELLALDERPFWSCRRWGVKALVAMGRKAEALRYAEESRDFNAGRMDIAQVCEEILLSSGMAEEAYRRYGIEANQRMTYVATFREIVRKYPCKEPPEILRDLIANSGEPGKWFAAAKSAGLLDEAIELASRSPCDPMTLARAARDLAEKEPKFAVEVGIAAIRWLAEGYGYDITGTDVTDAYHHTLRAAENAGCQEETVERLRLLVAQDRSVGHLVASTLGDKLGLTQ